MKEVINAEIVDKIPKELSFERKNLNEVSLEIAEYFIQKENEENILNKKRSRLDTLQIASEVANKILYDSDFRNKVKNQIESDVAKMIKENDKVYPILKTYKIYFDLEQIEEERMFLKAQEIEDLKTEFGYILGINNLGTNFKDVEQFNSFLRDKATEFLNSSLKDYETFIIEETKEYLEILKKEEKSEEEDSL